jgi:predicted transcriptional regulator
MVISFEELRHLKDSMPPGSIEKIADELGIDPDVVRNYFGGDHYDHEGSIPNLHIEKGVAGGLVELDNVAILEAARRIVAEHSS